MAGLKIEFKGIEKIRTLGSKVQLALKSSASLAPIRADAARIVSAQNARSFASSVDPDGRSWPQRAQPKKGRKIITRKLLIDTGKLRDSLLAPRTEISNFGRDLKITYSGEHAFLAVIHSADTAAKQRRGLPVREVGLRLGRQAQDEINAIAVKRIGEAFSKALKGSK